MDYASPPDDPWFKSPADGGWNGSVYFNGSICVSEGSSLSGHIYSLSYVGLMSDIIIINRYGSYIQGLHKSGKMSESLLRKDMYTASDYFVYDDYHDVWYHHAFYQDGREVVGIM
jgi:hypothetical protein